jgi:hypothetical protein
MGDGIRRQHVVTESTDEPERKPDGELPADTPRRDDGGAESPGPDTHWEASSPAAPAVTAGDDGASLNSASAPATTSFTPREESPSDRVRKHVRQERTNALLKIVAIGSWAFGMAGALAIALSIDADSVDLQLPGLIFAFTCLLLGGSCALEGFMRARLQKVAKVIPHAIAGLLANGLLLVLVVAGCGQLMETTFRMSTVSERKQLQQQEQIILGLQRQHAALERELAEFPPDDN